MVKGWPLPGHLLDARGLPRLTLMNDVREELVSDLLLRLGQEVVLSHELVDVAVGILFRSHDRSRVSLPRGVDPLVHSDMDIST